MLGAWINQFKGGDGPPARRFSITIPGEVVTGHALGGVGRGGRYPGLEGRYPGLGGREVPGVFLRGGGR